MLVFGPLAVIIDNLPDEHPEMIEVPSLKDPAIGVRVLLYHRQWKYIHLNDVIHTLTLATRIRYLITLCTVHEKNFTLSEVISAR